MDSKSDQQLNLRQTWSELKTIQEMFPEINKFEGSSKSYSGAGENIQFSTKVDGVPIRAKISFKPKDAINNNQRVETQIYEHVLKDLSKHIPHLPKWYDTFTTSFDPSKTNCGIHMYKKEWDITEATALIIEQIEGDLLSVFLETPANVSDPTVVFQVLYTLLCFERVGLNHNDMHRNNMMVISLPEPVNFCYEFDKEFITFESNYLVKIIDYDRATIYHPKVERNCYLDMLRTDTPYYQRNGYHPCSDVFKFLTNVYVEENEHGDIFKWIKLQCPKVISASSMFELDHLPFCVNARDLTGEISDLVRGLVQNFPDRFESFEEVVECKFSCTLPPMNAPKPVVNKADFCLPEIFFDEWIHNYKYIEEELLSFDYNWYAYAQKLYSDTCFNNLPKNLLFEACMWLTNPLKIWIPKPEVANIIDEIKDKFYPVLFLPNKSTPEINTTCWFPKLKKKKAKKHISPWKEEEKSNEEKNEEKPKEEKNEEKPKEEKPKEEKNEEENPKEEKPKEEKPKEEKNEEENPKEEKPKEEKNEEEKNEEEKNEEEYTYTQDLKCGCTLLASGMFTNHCRFLKELPQRYIESSSWHKVYDVKEVNKLRSKLKKVASKNLEPDTAKDMKKLLVPYDGTLNSVIKTMSLLVKKVPNLKNKHEKCVCVYILYSYLSRVLFHLKCEHSLISAIEGRIKEFKLDIDLEGFTNFDFDEIPHIKEVLRT